jgi:predicted PurR-regulated permease PerM
MPGDEVKVFETHLTETTVVRPSDRKHHWALNALGIAVILGLCYWGELVISVMMVSVLLAFVLAPVVDVLMRLRLPRGVAAFVAVVLLLALVTAAVVYFSNQALSFAQEVAHYAGKVRTELRTFWEKAETLGGLNPASPSKEDSSVASGNLTALFFRGFGSVTQALVVGSFIPFLVYFMLTWQHHVRSATVMLFGMENRHTAYVTLGLISAMIRSFMVGNLLIGLFMGIASTIVFGVLQFPFFYFVGFASGLLSLIPYMGVLLAMVPPLIVGLGHVPSEAIVGALITVAGMHVFALNVLYPKYLGPRLQLNPLAVTIALLIWGWLWGGMGLVLAIPITAAMKIVFDHIHALRPYGTWLGE